MYRHADGTLVLTGEIISYPESGNVRFSCLGLGEGGAPGNGSGVCSIQSGNTEKCSKVLRTDWRVRDVDGKADQSHEQTREEKWRTHLDVVGPRCEDDEEDHYCAAEICDAEREGLYLRAHIYGGTVNSWLTAVP